MKDSSDSSDLDSQLAESKFDRLMLNARGGGGEAVGQLLESFREYLLMLAESNLDSDLRPKVAASDVVQESILEAHKDFGQFRGTTRSELNSWLKRILLNNLLNHYRAWRSTQKRQLSREIDFARAGLNDSALADNGGDPTPSELVSQKEQCDRLRQVLEQLPDDYRTVIQLRHRERYSFSEIGSRMNRSSDAARMLWYRAFERLAQQLDRSS